MGSSGCSTVVIRQMLLCVCVWLRLLHFFLSDVVISLPALELFLFHVVAERRAPL